jgi:hypothetical protein
MTSEERVKISELLLERMLKIANSYAPIARDDTEFTERCKTFISSKTDEYLLTRLILGGAFNVHRTNK